MQATRALLLGPLTALVLLATMLVAGPTTAVGATTSASTSDDHAEGIASRSGLSFQQGRRTAVRFHKAWKKRDFATMKRLAKPDRVVRDWFRQNRAAPRGRTDCRAQHGDPQYGDHWYCWVRTRKGFYIGFRVEAVYDPSITWRVTGAALDTE